MRHYQKYSSMYCNQNYSKITSLILRKKRSTNIKSAFLCLLLLNAIPFLNIVKAEEVRGVGNIWAPWMFIGSSGIPEGVGVDVFREIAKRANLDYSVKIFPQVRRDKYFEENKVDVEVGVEPGWRGYQKDISVYTEPFFETENIVLKKQSSPLAVTDSKELQGKVIGGNIGYFYTDGFQEQMEAKKITRYDVKEGDALIKLVNAGRIDGAILDRFEAQYRIIKLGMPQQDFGEAYTFKTRSKLSFRFHKNKAYLVPIFNKYIAELKAEKFIEKTIESYMELEKNATQDKLSLAN